MLLDHATIKKIVESALAEDIGSGDITTGNILAPGQLGTAEIEAREELIVAGLPLARRAFTSLDPALVWQQQAEDGDRVKSGTTLVRMEGRALAILSAERVALNFLQRLSGIATATDRYVAKAAPYGVGILDTRKTTPGLRVLEKYAVKVGGGTNHRFGLYDAVMIKDNHIVAAGGIMKAVNSVKGKVPLTVKIEVETETLEQVQEALAAEVEIIMLDNMAPELMAQAVALIGRQAVVEASGGVTLENIEAVAASGVDYISVGALTQSIRVPDLGLNYRGE